MSSTRNGFAGRAACFPLFIQFVHVIFSSYSLCSLSLSILMDSQHLILAPPAEGGARLFARASTWSLLLFKFLLGRFLLTRLCRLHVLGVYVRYRFCRQHAFRSHLLGRYRLLLRSADFTGLGRLYGWSRSDAFRLPGFNGFLLQSRFCRLHALRSHLLGS